MSKSIWWLKETVYWRTSLNDARWNMAIPNQNRCNRSSPHSVRLKWRQTPNIIHIKNLFTSRTKLWNLQSWTTGNYSGIRRMATLYSRISTHHHYFIWSQNLDLLLRSQKAEPTTSTMVLYLSEFDVKLVYTPGNKIVCSIRHFIQKTRFMPRWRHHHVTWRYVPQPHWYKSAGKDCNVKQSWWQCYGSTQTPLDTRTNNNDNGLEWLDNWNPKWMKHSILQREELFPKNMDLQQELLWSWNSRTPRRNWDIQCSTTAVAWTSHICKKLCSRVWSMSTIQNWLISIKASLYSYWRNKITMAICQLFHRPHYRSFTGRWIWFYPGHGRPGLFKIFWYHATKQSLLKTLLVYYWKIFTSDLDFQTKLSLTGDPNSHQKYSKNF